MAALSICEALLLAMRDREVLPEREILGILSDAAVTHENAIGTEREIKVHKAVAKLIDQIVLGTRPIRHSVSHDGKE